MKVNELVIQPSSRIMAIVESKKPAKPARAVVLVLVLISSTF